MENFTVGIIDLKDSWIYFRDPIYDHLRKQYEKDYNVALTDEVQVVPETKSSKFGGE